jgi:hypothetical protein
MKRGFITIAIGKKYASQAKYLALSAMLHCPHVLRAVITDCPSILTGYYDFIIPYTLDHGNPFMLKTRINLYTPFENTIYFDADSLIINTIDSYWEALDYRSFAYAGAFSKKGKWYFDIEKIIEDFDLSWIARFNSGMFVFDKSERANSIFSTAHDYLLHQEKYNLHINYFRGKMLPDEPFFAISLAKHNEKPYDDNKRFSRGIAGASDIHLDVIKGIAYFCSDNKEYVQPLVVHFFGFVGNRLYKRETNKLFWAFNQPFSMLFAKLIVFIRNIYRSFFAEENTNQ